MTFGPFSRLIPVFVGDLGWKPNAPPDIVNGVGLMPGLVPIWTVFTQLSRGRNYSAMGSPLPVSYSDMEHAVARLSDHDPDECRVIFCALDDEYLAIASKQSGE